MVENLKKFLQKQISDIDGLHAIVVSDRDGVPIIKVADEKAPELSMRPGFLSTFSIINEQGSKLGYGRNNSAICLFKSYQVVQFNKESVMLVLIASADANTGMLLNLEDKLEIVVNDLKSALDIPAEKAFCEN